MTELIAVTLPAPPAPVKRSRNRRVNTCVECRRLKRKCSRTLPCLHCQQTSRKCVFPTPKVAPTKTRPSAQSVASAASGLPAGSRLGGARGLYPVKSDQRSSSSSAGGEQEETFSNGPHIASTYPSGPRRQQNHGSSPDDDYDEPAEPPDLCLRIGRMSMTERLGGVLRADLVLSIELALELDDRPPPDRFAPPIVAWFKPHATLPVHQLLGADPSALPAEFREDVLLTDPQRQALCNQYLLAVHPICHVVKPEDVRAELGPVDKALRLAVGYAAAASLPILESNRIFERSKDAVVKRLKLATEAALCRSNILGRTGLKMFQALVIYLTPQMITEVSRSHAVFVATVTRQFQIAGHDQDSPADSEEERQIKRHVWHQLLFLNLRATEAVGPERSLIDDQLSPMPDLVFPSDLNDDGILALVRYECLKAQRAVYRERELLKVDPSRLPAALEMTVRYQNDIQQRYLDRLDDRIPLQKCARMVGKLLSVKLETLVLATQWRGWSFPDTDTELLSRSVRRNLDLVETGVILETDPDLAPWAWYAGTYHQFHSMLALLGHLHWNPALPESERIIAMAAYVFGPSVHMAGEGPAGIRAGVTTILRAVRDNMASFLAAKGISDLVAAAETTDPRLLIQQQQHTHQHHGQSHELGQGPESGVSSSEISAQARLMQLDGLAADGDFSVGDELDAALGQTDELAYDAQEGLGACLEPGDLARFGLGAAEADVWWPWAG